MRANPVDLIGGFYKDDSLPWSCQDTVNWLPTRAEVPDTRTLWKLETCPGLRESLWLGDGSSPIRGMHDLEGQLYFVSGQTLYRKRVDGGVDALGLIPGVSRVQMTHNQFKTGYQLLVENGQGGGGYVWDTSANTFTKITDEGYPGSISSDYLDSFLLGVEPQGRYWFHSNLADATDYNTLDRYEAEAAPDRIVGLAVSQFEVVVFGQRTTEFFFNAGGTTGTFQNRRQSITRGCASRYSIQKLDNTLFWLGDDGIVYRLDGYSARRISTQPLEKAIASYNWSEAISYVWEDRGYKVYYLTFPDGLTFGYDVVSGLWTRRQSFGLDRWRLSHLVKCDGKWYGGDFQTGRLWTIDWDYYLEGQSPMIRRHVTGVLHDNQSQLIIPNVELIFGTGTLPTVPQAPLGPVPQYPGAPVLTGTLANACAGPTYTATLTATGGASPVTIRKSAGPVALTISPSGAISWPSPTVGTYTLSAQARDAVGRVSNFQAQFTIKPLTWNFTTWLPSGTYTSPFGVGQVFWSAIWSRYVSCTGPGRKLSADGITWTTNGAANYFNGAENPASGVMAFATGSTIVNSVDGGVNVATQSTSITIANAKLRFAAGQFVGSTNSTMVTGGASGTNWVEGPSYSTVVNSNPEWAYIDHLAKFILLSGVDGSTATSSTALGPYVAGVTVPSWGGNTGVGLTYVKRLKKLFIWTGNGVIRETTDLVNFTTRATPVGMSITDLIDIPEMGAVLAVGSGGANSTIYSLDSGVTWARVSGLNSFRVLAWSPSLARLVAIGQNVASYANATCVL
jgi:hypothetical protein